jgi:RNA polymerase sigma-70 factor (ECF subfamily)
MSGCAADADDLVQETLRRAIEAPPPDQERSLAPWLMRIATNLSIDHLRKRREAPYVGAWLPSPIDTDALLEQLPPTGPDAEARYEAWESVSYAFLVALEALDPIPRAVLLLRDVLGYSGPETAECLDLSAGNVRVILHRARAALQAFDEQRRPLAADALLRHEAVLGQLVAALAAGDLAEIEALLAEQARTVQDGGGEFKAALRTVSGRNNVARFFVGVRRFYPEGARSMEMLRLNGSPALLLELNSSTSVRARRQVIRLELDAQDRILEIQLILASRKLTHLPAAR